MTQPASASVIAAEAFPAMGEVVLTKVAGFKSLGDQLLAQAERAVIDSDEALSKGADLAKFAKVQLDKQDDARTALVKPLNDHVKFINAQFKPATSTLEKAIATIKTKMATYIEAREAEDQRRLEAARNAAQDMAVERAAELEANGRKDEAQAVVAAAADLPQATAKSGPARGNFGGVASFREDWTFEIEDFAKVPDAYKEIATKAVNAAIKDGVREIQGLRIFKKKNVAIR